jgi:hypothetical protein
VAFVIFGPEAAVDVSPYFSSPNARQMRIRAQIARAVDTAGPPVSIAAVPTNPASQNGGTCREPQASGERQLPECVRREGEMRSRTC